MSDLDSGPMSARDYPNSATQKRDQGARGEEIVSVVDSKPPIPKLAYRIDEVIFATGLGRTTIFDDIASGALKARKRGRATIILADDVTAYLNALPGAV